MEKREASAAGRAVLVFGWGRICYLANEDEFAQALFGSERAIEVVGIVRGEVHFTEIADDQRYAECEHLGIGVPAGCEILQLLRIVAAVPAGGYLPDFQFRVTNRAV